MTGNPNKLSQFWQELKRRKVIKVIAMYAGATYILIELANNVVEPLNLPDWTPRFVILIALIGFPITVILSWIFDITPEGIKKTESIDELSEQEPTTLPTKRGLKTSDVIISVLIVAVCILLYPKIFSTDKFEDIRDTDGRISIAVMPFENMTGDTTLNEFQRGISSLIINGLGNSSELSVRDDHTMYEIMESMGKTFTAGISPRQAKEVAEKSRSETYISGSYQGTEGKYWILVNLVDTESGGISWTGKVEGDLNSSEYLDLADSLCNEIKNYLEIQVLKQDVDYDFREAYTYSADAYRYFIQGMNSILKLDYDSGIESLKKALEIDSTFTFAAYYIAYAYYYNYQLKQSIIWIQKTYNTKDRLPLKYQYWLESGYAMFISKNLQDILRYCNLLKESGIESRLLLSDLGDTYWAIQQYEKAIEALEKVEEISQERGDDWKHRWDYFFTYGNALHEVGKHDKENEILEIGLRVYPKNIYMVSKQAICALSLGDTAEANEHLEKYKSIVRERDWSEAALELNFGRIFQDANIIDKAEVHFRNAYELKPQNMDNVFGLANILINNDINVDEGMELIQKGLEIEPDFIQLLWAKGWGCYKQGKYEEAIQLLRMTEENLLYLDLELHQQIQEVEQARASKNN